MLVYYLEYGGYWVELPRGDTLVGRDVHCALRFNDPAISRQHLRFERRGGDVIVEDLGSSNGTIINGTPLAGTHMLVDGDRIRIGSRELAFRAVDDAAEQASTRREVTFAAFSQIAASNRPTVPTPRSLGAQRSQRCPKCGADVVASDQRCKTCGYDWDRVRPRAATLDSPNERRGDERIAIELHLVYRSAELEIEATTRDLSASGVFVCTEVLEPIGTRCELTMLVDGGPPVSLGGVVRRVVEQAGTEPVGLGIEFVELGATERKWLELALVRSRVTEPFDRA